MTKSTKSHLTPTQKAPPNENNDNAPAPTVQTAIVRCGQLGPDGTLVKQLQQVMMLGPLVVPALPWTVKSNPRNDTMMLVML